jgi:hypothetical protein
MLFELSPPRKNENTMATTATRIRRYMKLFRNQRELMGVAYSLPALGQCRS